MPRGIHAVDDGTDWNFYAQDGLGSVRAVVNDMAVVQSSMGYDPYGNPFASYGAGFGFTGEQTDANGSVFLRARYYEPSLGTFSALDPWEGISNRPMSLNGYAWVEGNVVNATDPSGKMPNGFRINMDMSGLSSIIQSWTDAYVRLLTIPSLSFVKRMNSGMCDEGKIRVLGRSKSRSNSMSNSGFIPFYRDGGSDIPQDSNSDTIPPYVPPPIDGNSAQSLIDVVGDYNRICRELCNEDSEDYILNHLSGSDCRRNAQDICSKLCLWSPRSVQNTVDHTGLIIRWLDFFIDRNNSRPSHIQPYGELQDELTEILGNEGLRRTPDGGNFYGWNSRLSNCRDQGDENEIVAEFDAVAQRWSEKSLPFSIALSPVPECNTTAIQYVAVGALALVTLGLLVLVPSFGEEAIPVAGMGVVAPCLISG